MRRKTLKNKIMKYTAFAPKTIKATKNVGRKSIKKIKYFLNNTTKTFKKLSKSIDKTTAKSIRSLTKKGLRR
jgi:hypothetical protein